MRDQDNEKKTKDHRPVYVSPRVIRLGDVSSGIGACQPSGSAPAGGACSSTGASATSGCTTGNGVKFLACKDGNGFQL